MKKNKSNKCIEYFARTIIKYRWLLIILTLLISAFGVTGLQYVEQRTAREDWFSNAEAIEIATRKFENQFGNNDNIGILVEAKDVFDPEVLKAIKALGEELLDSIPYAKAITSLVETEISIGTKEGIEVTNPFEGGIPDDPQKIEEIRKLILSRKSLANKLVSDDCTETWISLSLLEYPPETEWSKNTTLAPTYQVGEAAIRLLSSPKWKSEKYTLKPAGLPYTETEEHNYFNNETKRRILSGFIIMVALLIFFTRSFRGVFVPTFTTIIGIVVVFGTMGWFGIVCVRSNMMTIPIMLGMALSIGYSIHLINAFKRNFRETGKRKEAAIEAVKETGWPIFFTAMTTIVSVLSFVAVGIITIQWVGYISAAVIFADYLFVMTLIPVLMSFGKDKEVGTEVAEKNMLIESWMKQLGIFVLKYKTAILGLFAVGLVIVSIGLRKITINMDLFSCMGTKVPYVKRIHEVVNSQLGSYLTYNITVAFDKPDAIKDPEVLKSFDALLDTVSHFELTKKNEKAVAVFSVLDIIKEINQTLNSDSIKYHTIPDNSNLIAQEFLLYEMSGGTKLFNWIDEDYSMLHAQVGLQQFDSNEITRELQVVKRIGAETLKGATVDIVGNAVQFAELNKKVVTGELKSIAWTFVIIVILFGIVFGSMKTGLIGMIPNIVPLVFIGGYMGHFNLPLDMTTMIIMPMLLGLSVDDTIHFIDRIKNEFKRCGNYYQAIIVSYQTIGGNIAMTTIILSATLLTYTFSLIANLIRIGYLVPMGMTVALLADYLVTPVLIYVTKPFGKEKK